MRARRGAADIAHRLLARALALQVAQLSRACRATAADLDRARRASDRLQAHPLAAALALTAAAEPAAPCAGEGWRMPGRPAAGGAVARWGASGGPPRGRRPSQPSGSWSRHRKRTSGQRERAENAGGRAAGGLAAAVPNGSRQEAPLRQFGRRRSGRRLRPSGWPKFFTVDGPDAFLEHSARYRTRPIVEQRLLRWLGYDVVRFPHFELERVRGPRARTDYMAKLLGQAGRFARLDPADE